MGASIAQEIVIQVKILISEKLISRQEGDGLNNKMNKLFVIIGGILLLFWMLSGLNKSNHSSELTDLSGPKCHPNYSGCLNPKASDYDCAGGSGNGPYYTGRIQVIGPDIFGLDRDGDGWGCE
ncbi:MAG: hypothetical protein WAW15_02015 [Minisyncoccales bacterium]